MTIETVTVQYVNQPKAGKSYGSIKVADGRYISVHQDKLGLFRKDGTYVIETEQNGQYHNFKRIVSDQSASAPQGATPNSSSGRNDDATAERIFVCGIVNAAVGAGHDLSGQGLVDLVRRCRKVWAYTFGGLHDPQAQALQPAQAPASPPQQEPPSQPYGHGATGYAPMPPTHGNGPIPNESIPF